MRFRKLPDPTRGSDHNKRLSILKVAATILRFFLLVGPCYTCVLANTQNNLEKHTTPVGGKQKKTARNVDRQSIEKDLIPGVLLRIPWYDAYGRV